MRSILTYVAAVTLLCACTLVGLAVYMVYTTQPYIFSSVTEAPVADAALVLGASVMSDGTLSPILKKRADRAVQLYQNHTVSKILVTGDNSSLAHNEVRPVGNYLVSMGVPKQDIFLDYAGFDTYSSMYRAREVFEVSSVLIVSQQFHLPRAVFVARSLGIQAYGVSASEEESYLYNSVREIPASGKAMFDILINRQPKYLGEKIPITGDSTVTWQ